MAVRHVELPIHGVQFHPESILTEGGHRMLANWLGYCGTQPDEASGAPAGAGGRRHRAPRDPPAIRRGSNYDAKLSVTEPSKITTGARCRWTLA